jgi:hypothetical protein
MLFSNARGRLVPEALAASSRPGSFRAMLGSMAITGGT